MANKRNVRDTNPFGLQRVPTMQELTDAMIAPLAPAADGSFRIGKYTLTPIGLRVDGMTSEMEWVEVGLILRQLNDGLGWLIGDWVNLGEFQYGKTYEQLCELSGLAYDTVRDYAYVARQVELSFRNDKLSFGHHKAVAPMTPELQAQWLEWAAAQESLSVKDLRMAIRGAQELPAKAASMMPRTAWKAAERFASKPPTTPKQKAAARAAIDELRAWLDDLERGL